MAQCLRSLAVLPADPGLIQHLYGDSNILTLVPGHPMSSSDCHMHYLKSGVQEVIHAGKILPLMGNIYILKKQAFKKFC